MDKSEEVEADVERLKNFGVYMALKALSNDNILLHEELLKQPYGTILLALWVLKEESEYADRLRKVMDKRAKRK